MKGQVVQNTGLKINGNIVIKKNINGENINKGDFIQYIKSDLKSPLQSIKTLSSNVLKNSGKLIPVSDNEFINFYSDGGNWYLLLCKINDDGTITENEPYLVSFLSSYKTPQIAGDGNRGIIITVKTLDDAKIIPFFGYCTTSGDFLSFSSSPAEQDNYSYHPTLRGCFSDNYGNLYSSSIDAWGRPLCAVYKINGTDTYFNVQQRYTAGSSENGTVYVSYIPFKDILLVGSGSPKKWWFNYDSNNYTETSTSLFYGFTIENTAIAYATTDVYKIVKNVSSKPVFTLMHTFNSGIRKLHKLNDSRFLAFLNDKVIECTISGNSIIENTITNIESPITPRVGIGFDTAVGIVTPLDTDVYMTYNTYIGYGGLKKSITTINGIAKSSTLPNGDIEIYTI